ncbi:hypothetical protein MTQ12_11370 [Brevibacterium sp. R8603A2]|uniref:hypothetical protein n=1 Tax=Brevibacterium sp. R8603A2 TaxID=2929779 RepID=UPI001FFBB68F|nr:hypothetical protein [Brevibacterium sp. R8603A2]MCK1803638.1 hypothetical protein [Brevibacterium sp. R8603A2]
MTDLLDSASTLLGYGALLLPGLLLLGVCFWLARADRDPLLRIVVLICDAMTPTRLWEFGLVGDFVPGCA